jgi:hypothetical protein
MTAPTEPTPQTLEPPKELPGIFGGLSFKLAEVLGVGVTAASAAVAAWSSIRENFYRNVARYKVFKDVHDVRDREYTELYKRFADKGEKEALIKGINEIEGKYTAEVSKRMEGLGIVNTLDRWRTLKTHQKAEIAVTVAGVSAILLGAVVNLSASRRIREQQQEMSDHLTQTDHVSKLEQEATHTEQHSQIGL